MSAVQIVVESRSRHVVVAAGYAAIVGAFSVALAILDTGGGETPAIGRALLGLLGIAAGALLWTRPKVGWIALLVWTALQIPYVAWNTDGSLFAQVIYFPLSISSSTTVNGEITQFSAYGINLIGVILTVVAAKWRSEWLSQNR